MIRRLLALALAVLVGCLVPFGLASAADAQLTSPRRIGFLCVAWGPDDKELQAFRQGLLDAGYFEGRDLVIEWRFANGDYARIPELVADLVQRKVDVIVSDSTQGTQALKRATSTIPVVMTSIADPVGSGFVTSLAHPGGNVTGLTIMTADLSAKRLQLLKETIPQATRVAALRNPDSPYHPKVVEDLKAATSSLAIELSFVDARTPEQFGRAISAVSRAHAQALYVIDDSVFFAHRTTLLNLASKARLPVTYGQREFVVAGALMSYGPSFSDLFRRTAGYVDKILKGAKPGDLPVEQPTKFDLVVNLKTAKALGITIPESILLRADELIR
jgi:putative tryptophan/tyrosine transport system substrate-binding protein